MGDGVARSEGKASVPLGLGHHLGDVLPHLLLGESADRVGVDAAEIANAVTVALHPHGERGDLILVGVLGVDPCPDQILHDAENVAAGVEQEGEMVAVHQVNDGFVLGDNQRQSSSVVEKKAVKRWRMRRRAEDLKRVSDVIQADKSVMSDACKALVLQDFAEKFNEYFDLIGLPRMEIDFTNGEYTVEIVFKAERIKRF